MYAFYQLRNNLYPVSPSVVDAAIDHAIEQYPNECCGVVIDGRYFKMPNIHPRPRDDFMIQTEDYFALVQKYGPLEAVIHSHPTGKPGPSHSDMTYQQAAAVPFGIIVLGSEHAVRDVVFFGDTVPIAPEVGRPFIHGVYDCYSLGRDHLRTTYGLVLPNFPRSVDWWEPGMKDNLLEDNFTKAGFVAIGFNELKPGDALMCHFAHAQKVNHCGVYIGDGRILHHLHGTPLKPRLSTIEPVYNWRRFSTHALRHKNFLQGPAT
jgi:proteasome lid subunit RPN8/RPN11